MATDTKTASLTAFRRLLRPVVRILLRGGVTCREAADACKAAFVEIATEDYGLHGRPTSVSRVAILTGLGRREVSRLREQLQAEPLPEPDQLNAATRVLTGWHLDKDFLDASGKPLDLQLQASGASFTSLVRRYGGDIAPITMLHELHRAGALEQRPDGGLRVLKRYYMPAMMDPAATVQAGSMLEDLGNAAYYNLTRPEDSASRVVGRATNVAMRSADVPEFRRLLETECQQLLERVDAWMSEREIPPGSTRRHRKFRLGVGVFQIHDE